MDLNFRFSNYDFRFIRRSGGRSGDWIVLVLFIVLVRQVVGGSAIEVQVVLLIVIGSGLREVWVSEERGDHEHDYDHEHEDGGGGESDGIWRRFGKTRTRKRTKNENESEAARRELKSEV